MRGGGIQAVKADAEPAIETDIRNDLFSDNIRVNPMMVYSPATNQSQVLTDLNDAEDNVLYHFLMATTDTLPAHYPEQLEGLKEFFLLTVTDIYYYREEPYEYKLQYIIDSTRFVAIAHRKWVDDWDSWNITEFGNKREIIVSADGTGQYTSVSEAVSHASDGDVIYVKKGIYDNETITAWGKNITIIGEDKYQTVIMNGYNDYEHPPLEMDVGCLENLTLYAYDGQEGQTGQYGPSYGLHIEHNSMTNGTFTAKDIVCKSDLHNGCGIGLRPGCQVHFENCEFWSLEAAGVFFHDCATGAEGQQSISFNNCKFWTEKGSYSLRIHSQRFGGSMVVCEFIGCSLGNANGTAPRIYTHNAEDSELWHGTATTAGDLLGLVNFYKSKLNNGNNMSELNYMPTSY